MNIYEKLLLIQQELKAPKGQRNTFGKYNYRSAEDILEAVKPICAKHKAVLTLTDELTFYEGRHYINAKATLTDVVDAKQVSVSSYAREEENKKGMDGSQITGASSSYARKYALNGLFCIDDTKDSDATNTHGKQDVANSNPQRTETSEKKAPDQPGNQLSAEDKFVSYARRQGTMTKGVSGIIRKAFIEKKWDSKKIFDLLIKAGIAVDISEVEQFNQ